MRKKHSYLRSLHPAKLKRFDFFDLSNRFYCRFKSSHEVTQFWYHKHRPFLENTQGFLYYNVPPESSYNVPVWHTVSHHVK